MTRLKIFITEAFWVCLAIFFMLWILESLIPGLNELTVNHQLVLGLTLVSGFIGIAILPETRGPAHKTRSDGVNRDYVDDSDYL